MSKGPLIRVEIGPNRYAKMHRDDAIARGLIGKPGKKKKQRRPAADKMRRGPLQDKQAKYQQEVADTQTAEEPDDLTTIRGIGEATIEALYTRGILTFEQLRTADVSDLPGQARRAIQDWRKKQEREMAEP